MTTIVKRFKLAVATIGLGAIVTGSYSVLTAASARAQTTGSSITNFKSMGPVKLNPNESALIGLLFPAVRGAYQDAQFELFDSSGKMLAEVPMAMGDGSVRGAQYHIAYADGSVRLTDSAGHTLMTVRSTDGIVTGLLLPVILQGAAGDTPAGSINAAH